MRYVGALIVCVGCLSNFDQFLSDASAPKEGGNDGGPIDSGTPCDAGASCTSTATTCANGCRDAGATCIANCTNNGCKNNCMQVQQTCIDKCRQDCVTCTGNTACGTACGQATD